MKKRKIEPLVVPTLILQVCLYMLQSTALDGGDSGKYVFLSYVIFNFYMFIRYFISLPKQVDEGEESVIKITNITATFLVLSPIIQLLLYIPIVVYLNI